MSNTNTQRTELAAQLEAAEKELGGLQAELDAFGERRDTNGIFLGAAPNSRHSEVLTLIPGAENRVQSLREQLAEFDKAENYRRQVAEAPRKAKISLGKWQTASRLAVELDSKAANLKTRLEVAGNEIASAEDAATSAETDAARAYAAAISSGDQKAEAAALAKLKKTQEASARAKAAAASNAFVIGALQSELTALEQQAQAARAEAVAHRCEAFGQLAIRLQAAWDAKAAELATLGAKLVAASNRAEIGHGLSDTRIPTFGAGGDYRYRDFVTALDDVTDDSLVIEVGGSK
jgi:hypothetical protein